MLYVYQLLSATPVKHYYEQLFAERFTEYLQTCIKNVFEALKLCKMHYGNTMNVFYAHVLCPHEPIIFSKQARKKSVILLRIMLW